MTDNPLSPARDEKRRLAQCLEPHLTLAFAYPADFFSDEAANAMLLEAMPAPELYCHPPDHSGPEKGWRCRPDWGLDFAVYDPDRKTAIVKAYIAYREAQK